jgi:RimJ/RimL family protein N-acetyltransferase
MRLYLRPITEDDGAFIVKWRNSEKVRKHCMTKTPITEESNLKFFKENVLTGKYKQYIVERIEEETGLVTYPIATAYLKDIDHGNNRCELCVFTSNDVEWEAEGQIMAVKMLLEKAFNEFGMHKVYSYVIHNVNEGMEVLKGAGFEVEAVLKSEAKQGDKYVDVYRMCIYNNQV